MDQETWVNLCDSVKDRSLSSFYPHHMFNSKTFTSIHTVTQTLIFEYGALSRKSSIYRRAILIFPVIDWKFQSVLESIRDSLLVA